MIHSMTGYGKAEGNFAEKKIIVEIKSLNSKQLDLSMRIANCYREKDLDIRNLLARRIERGKVDFVLYIDNSTSANSAPQINTALIESYVWQIKHMAEKLKVAVPANWFETLLKMPDVYKVSEVSTLSEEEWNVVLETINQAIENFIAFRKQEGESLQIVFNEKIASISQLLQDVEPFEGERIAKIRARLEENLQSLSEKMDIDKNRLEQELIYYIEKLDINEEKVRLRNHLKYFIETMQEDGGQGKKLGFIAQEIGREVNTLGSKSNQSEMQQIVVKMKDQLEQIKEQVLNVM